MIKVTGNKHNKESTRKVQRLPSNPLTFNDYLSCIYLPPRSPVDITNHHKVTVHAEFAIKRTILLKFHI